MAASRLLVDVISEWGACDEIDGRPGQADKKRGRRSDHDKRISTLERTIEGEVIPRLMLSHSLAGSSQNVLRSSKLHALPEDVSELARLVLLHDDRVAYTFLDTLRSRGLTVETLFLELIAPAARLLGQMWHNDVCDFTDVTVGLSRLQHLLHELSPAFDQELTSEFTGRRILLIPTPGEQHTLGITMVEEFFRRAGWDCCSAAPPSLNLLGKLVKLEHFDAIAISASCDGFKDTIKSAISEVRKSSLNKAISVIVGGRVFATQPGFAAQVGADATAENGRDAVLQLRSLFDTRISQ